MEDLRKRRQKNLIRWKKTQLNFLKLYYWLNKNKIKVVIFVLLIFIIFFPKQSGQLIHNWIHDFFFTINPPK